MRKNIMVWVGMVWAIILCGTLWGQTKNGSIQGKIFDASTRETIPLVTVYLSKPGQENQVPDGTSIKGAISDFNGFYRLENVPGTYNLHFSAVGYTRVTKEVTLKAGEILFLDLHMEPSSLELNEVVYSESRNPTKLEESTVSISLVKPSLVQNRNATSAEAAIEQIPGVAIVDAEPQIRGGSGFSSGLGSRVMILIDDMPLVRGDAGRPVWSFYPMENMDQIEVVKGASSVLYGSGASNGVINIRTAFPGPKPETKVTFFAGTWNRPRDSYKTPWTGFNPLKTGANFYHSRIFKTKDQKLEMDFVVGGQALWDDGFRGGEPVKSQIPTLGDFDSTRTNRGEYEKSIRVNFNTRFRLKSIEGLSFGLNGNVLYMQEGQSFFWQDSDTNIYRMSSGSLTNFRNSMLYIDPYVMYRGKKGTSHILRARWFQSWSDGDVKGSPADVDRLAQDTRARTLFAEYQFSRNLTETGFLPFLTKNLTFTGGVSINHTWSKGGVFASNGTGDSVSTAMNVAAYAQLEKVMWKRWTLTGGARWEYFKLLDYTANRPVFRVGSNFRLTQGTYVRASIGQGFRFPTIGERFISVSSGGSGFFANPNLRPEESWSAEIGIKQLFKMGKSVKGFFDLAGFWQEYKDYVEFAFENSNLAPSGFRFYNTGRARIRGVEAMAFANIRLGKKAQLDLNMGYTYSLPQTMEPDKNFGSYLSQNYITGDVDTFYISYNNTISDTTIRQQGILKYRIEHLVRADAQFTWKWLSFGASARYYSTMRQLDNFFFATGTPFASLPQFLARQGAGAWVFDARVAVQYKNYRFAFIVDNILNEEYSVRPLGIAPPRLTTLQVSVKF